jgi:DNA-binding transcriptional ArsR family regulator
MRENRRVTRYFSVYASTEEISFMACFRNCNTRQIILKSLLKCTNGCSFRELVHYTNKSPSTVFWHLKKLKEAKKTFCLLSIVWYHIYSGYYQNQHIYCVKLKISESKRKTISSRPGITVY